MAGIERFFDEIYVREKEISPRTAQQYRITIRKFETWHAGAHGEPVLDSLNNDRINEWVTSLQRAENLSPYTARSKQRQICAIANLAFELEHIDRRVDRRRRIKVPDTPKDVWSPEQIGRMIELCNSPDARFLRGRFNLTRIPKRAYVRALIAFAWDTSLRREDLTRVRLEWVTDSRIFTIVQGKTMSQVPCRIFPSTQRLIFETTDSYTQDRELLFPLWYRPAADPVCALNAMTRVLKKVMSMAGLSTTDGPFQKLRRSSVTYTEQLEFGSGTRRAGHADPNITRRSYIHPSTAYPDCPSPPELPIGAGQ